MGGSEGEEEEKEKTEPAKSAGQRAAGLVLAQWPRGSADISALNNASYKIGLLVNGGFLASEKAEAMLEEQIKARPFSKLEDAKSVSLMALNNGRSTVMEPDAILREVIPDNDKAGRFSFETYDDLLEAPAHEVARARLDSGEHDRDHLWQVGFG